MKINIILFFITLMSIISCGTNSEENKENQIPKDDLSFTMYPSNRDDYNNDSIRNYKIAKVLNDGDSACYSTLSLDYSVGGATLEFMYYSLIMSQKNKNKMSYFFSYFYYDLLKTQPIYQKLAHWYLIKGYFLGDKSAQTSVSVEFGTRDENNVDIIDTVRLRIYEAKLDAYFNNQSISY